jgi:hypothetical protein
MLSGPVIHLHPFCGRRYFLRLPKILMYNAIYSNGKFIFIPEPSDKYILLTISISIFKLLSTEG